MAIVTMALRQPPPFRRRRRRDLRRVEARRRRGRASSGCISRSSLQYRPQYSQT